MALFKTQGPAARNVIMNNLSESILHLLYIELFGKV